MSNYKRLVISIVAILIANSVNSQTVTGIVLDSLDRTPVYLANIISLKEKDSTFLKGTVTNQKGEFTIDITDSGFLTISNIGYKTKTLILNQSGLKTILLERNIELLGEAVIVSKTNRFKFSEKGLTINVQNSFLEKIGKASDLLDKMPLISKKDNDYIVFGRGKPLIYVNDRLLRDNTELQTINSSEIKSVEIIMSPGAEYSSSAGAVLKISLKKPAGEGVGLIVSSSADINRKFSYDNTISLNYRRKGLDIFGTISGFNRKSIETIYLSNTMNFNSLNTLITSTGDYEIHGLRWMATAGFNQQINNNHSFGMKYIYSDMPVDNKNIVSNYKSYIDNVYSGEIGLNEDKKGKAGYYYLNAYYLAKITKKTSIKLDLDFSEGDSKENTNISKLVSNNTDNIITLSESDYQLAAGKIKIDTDIFKGKFSFGGEFSYTTDRPEFTIVDNTQSNDLQSVKNESQQELYSLFTSYRKSIKKFTFEAGLRFENSNFNYTENGVVNNLNSKTYNGIYPNLSVSYRGDKIQSSLAFRNSVSRPNYYMLANSVNYINEFTLSSGNPYLLPTEKSEIIYTLFWKNFYGMTSYSYFNNKIIHYNTQYENRNIILNKPVNLDHSNILAVGGGCSHEWGIWQTDIEISMLKQNLKAGNPLNRYNKAVFLAKVQNNIQLNDNNSIMLSFSGNTKGNSDITEYRQKYKVDVGYMRTMMNGNIRFNLFINDIFGTDIENWMMSVNNIIINQRKILDSRGISFSVTFRFNSTRSKYRGTSASNELDRLSK
ncbi:MAG: hypothetical protein A2X19_11090 [Bacteroidetes bacterium GWE2_39_28]|nr:MAG: hypothetical protein A2X19_11090 [Bacteroidetes bacterium GWE2_39_28]OFY13463.1 MAG: hypothetical protein A2X16_07290 [Bacteroidetes bacterium GWF2_39_10]OFZ08348.1 MAG: hypothetical protein A2322_08835 [Bacteroidetes bacterium RIFOXYB2_FULL_39_7]OFZ09704.1 MAG: hypothetical protein A2465_11020 [Bacteroidetes bacterium RIFOXYC2_FULL_39_11]HCT94792.1 hypothetical protein [Rikenellaceae bacterium]